MRRFGQLLFFQFCFFSLFSYQAYGFSNLQRCSDFTYEPVQKVQVYPLGRMSFVTVFSNAAGNLKLTAWHIDRNGKLFVKGTATAGKSAFSDTFLTEVQTAP